MTNTTPILRVNNLTKSFGGNTILDSVSFQLAKGEIKVLIGPSGGGKSTLLQCMNCLVVPDHGEIRLEDKQIDFTSKQELYHLRQQVGMIFQDFNLFDHLTALDNITIALRKVKKSARLKQKSEQEWSLCRSVLQRKKTSTQPNSQEDRNSVWPSPEHWLWIQKS